ncbi:MAG: sel1 repeat family protein [Gammaproteobacteria bacterium]|nr:sel1 repeat family protein [Gammaproteobacteria bacterium]
MLRCFSIVVLVAVVLPAGADIDVSILRAATPEAPVRPAGTSAAASAALEKPGAAAADSTEQWYRRASDLDRPGASRAELEKAAYWYRAAAQQGHSDAQTNLAAMYAEGRGVAFDALEAARLYRRAAEAGNARAQYSLALMYHLGQGVEKDFAGAIRWYERAARQGDANAMNNMAFMYGIGEGVEQSNVEAYAWFALAASRGNADAAQNRDVAAQELTPEERRQARERFTQLEQQLGL